MEKRRFGPKTTMKGLPKASAAKINFLSLPKEVETSFDTGYGKNNNSKWEIEIELLEHPNQEPGVMVWQTTAQVIRIEIVGLIQEAEPQTKKVEDLFKDLSSNSWEIISDDNGIINIQEL